MILFLCIGNSCRSQMAEGFARYLGLNAISAGVSPIGLNHRAASVMKEIGIDISMHGSKEVEPWMIKQAEVIITLCKDADDICATVVSKIKRIHWPIDDPAKAFGTEDVIMQKFRDVRDEIKKRVEELNEEYLTKI